MTQADLTSFRDYVGEIQDLRSVQGLLGWDLETVMPPDGAEIRAAQMSTLAKLSHAMLTSDRMKTLLDPLRAAQSTLERVDRALVREVSREFDRECKIPPRLVQEMTEITAKAHPVWVDARQHQDFSRFAPVLEKIVALSRETARAIGETASPYDALMDLYEPGLTTSQVDPLFSELRMSLVPLVHAISESTAQPDRRFLEHQCYDTDRQWTFTLTLLKDMGFDFEAGRQDKAAHPFTMGMGARDVRVTTRLFETDLLSSIFSSVHEGGHALYEQGIDPSLSRTFLDGGASLGIHESQSRLWENLVGRSKPFWQHYFPILQALYPQELAQVDATGFYRAVNAVKPSFIRVEADEVTYNLHIMVRYTLEKAVIEGQLEVKDIPAEWNRLMKDMLGITPPNDALGALQDVHWSHGSFGYFPTYTLGNLYGVQLFNTAEAQLPTLQTDIAQGNLLPLKDWLNTHVHRWSKVESPAEIIRRVTGGDLQAQPFVDYLWAKYGDLYNLKRSG